MEASLLHCQWRMAPPCRALGHEIEAQAPKKPPLPGPVEVRQRWTAKLVEMFQPDPEHKLRSWDIALYPDGSVAHRASLTASSEGQYFESRFRIPPSITKELSREEKVVRTEKFALGSLLYEILSEKKIFPDIKNDDMVQDRFRRGEVPDDVYSLTMGPYILGCWNREFEKELEYRLSLKGRLANHIKQHPYLFAAEVAGGVTSAASLVALPFLGAIGFGAAGPVASTAAAAWQASTGAVQVGSVFAWCQSAAMGGAAVGGIVGAGVAGGTTALAATGTSLILDGKAMSPEMLREMFQKLYREEGEKGGEGCAKKL